MLHNTKMILRQKKQDVSRESVRFAGVQNLQTPAAIHAGVAWSFMGAVDAVIARGEMKKNFQSVVDHNSEQHDGNRVSAAYPGEWHRCRCCLFEETEVLLCVIRWNCTIQTSAKIYCPYTM